MSWDEYCQRLNIRIKKKYLVQRWRQYSRQEARERIKEHKRIYPMCSEYIDVATLEKLHDGDGKYIIASIYVDKFPPSRICWPWDHKTAWGHDIRSGQTRSALTHLSRYGKELMVILKQRDDATQFCQCGICGRDIMDDEWHFTVWGRQDPICKDCFRKLKHPSQDIAEEQVGKWM